MIKTFDLIIKVSKTRLKRIESKIAREAASKAQNTFKTQNISKTQNTSYSQNNSYTQNTSKTQILLPWIAWSKSSDQKRVKIDAISCIATHKYS